MPTLTIDNKTVRVRAGGTILEAARGAGIAIPTLCHLRGHPALTSCFVCVVKVQGVARLLPACATHAEEGMVVESDSAEVRAARKAALELLLSDHLGDCLAPCQLACPAHPDLPAMLRHLAAGEIGEALAAIRDALVLPATLGQICAGFCEKACRRAQRDGAVAIRALHGYLGEMAADTSCVPLTGKPVAIVGAGPAGLAAAYTLLLAGHPCVLFDNHSLPGGMLRYGVEEERLPRTTLEGEIARIRALGAEFRGDAEVTFLAPLRKDFAAILIANGEIRGEQAAAFGLEMAGNGLRVEQDTLMTNLPGVFAAGSAVTPTRHAVRAVASGRAAARAIRQFLAGDAITPEPRPFSTRMGRLCEEELATFYAGTSAAMRIEPAGDGYSEADARAEAGRCLHCDCRKRDYCQLRDAAIANGADPRAYAGGERRRYTIDRTHAGVIYEAGKCIACGKCIAIAEAAREPLGLTFIGRGFSVRTAVPFAESLADGLRTVAEECAAQCPTGALVKKA